MAVRATGVLGVLVVCWTSRFAGAHAMVHAVTRETQLVHPSEFQQPRIGRAMRRMAGRTSFGLERRVLVSERTLLVCMTFNARRIGAGCQPRLLEFETAVRIVTITALHRAFEHLVMKGLVEVGLNLVVTADTELRFSNLEQITGREVRLFRIGSTDVTDRLRNISTTGLRV